MSKITVISSNYLNFYKNWCSKCVHEADYRETGKNGCSTLLVVMSIDTPFKCSKFEEYRCTKTIDMFEKEKANEYTNDRLEKERC